MTIFQFSCFLTAISIGLNAFGHHALSQTLSVERLSMFETASQYLLFGGLWLLSLTRTPKLPKYALALLITGIALFCGSLLIYLILPIKALMLLTPIGGLTLIAAFVYLGLNANENA